MLKKIFFFIIFLLFLSFLFLIFTKKLTKEKINYQVETLVETISETKENLLPLPTKILESGLPNKYLIKTLFVPQAPEKNWNQPWQDACEEASLLTVDFYYRQITDSDPLYLKDSLQKMLDYESSMDYSHDLNLEQMAQVARDYLGYQTLIIDNPSVDLLKSYLLKDIPVVVTANGKTLYQENRHFSSGGPYYHSLVILGYDQDKEKFIVHDVGTQHGSYFKYSYSLLLESIHDFPQSGKKEDIDHGDKKVLLLLKQKNIL